MAEKLLLYEHIQGDVYLAIWGEETVDLAKFRYDNILIAGPLSLRVQRELVDDQWEFLTQERFTAPTSRKAKEFFKECYKGFCEQMGVAAKQDALIGLNMMIQAGADLQLPPTYPLPIIQTDPASEAEPEPYWQGAVRLHGKEANDGLAYTQKEAARKGRDPNHEMKLRAKREIQQLEKVAQESGSNPSLSSAAHEARRALKRQEYAQAFRIAFCTLLRHMGENMNKLRDPAPSEVLGGASNWNEVISHMHPASEHYVDRVKKDAVQKGISPALAVQQDLHARLARLKKLPRNTINAEVIRRIQDREKEGKPEEALAMAYNFITVIESMGGLV